MPLTLRPTGLASPVDQDRIDYVVIDCGRKVGRIYEDKYVPADGRWFWSILLYVDPRSRIVTYGKVAAFDEAKSRWRANYKRAMRAAGPTLGGWQKA